MIENDFDVKIDKSIILVGNSGHGKTTLLNYIARKRLIWMKNNSTDRYCIEQNDGFSIGHCMKSCTNIPNKCVDEDNYYWDCPGFENSSVQQEISNASYFKKISSASKNIKLVLVLLLKKILISYYFF